MLYKTIQRPYLAKFTRRTLGTLQRGEVKLTLHVHVGRLVHEMHEELGGVDEDLVSAVSDGAIPPCALCQRGDRQREVSNPGEGGQLCVLEVV